LGQNGHLFLDHECADCSKPYKPGPGEMASDDSLSVRMVVMDGLVAGPTVSLSPSF
jgi:hypothetical protein